MPLPDYAGLHWYGPGMAAAVGSGAGAEVALLTGQGRVSAVQSGGGAVALAKGTRLVNSPCIVAGTGGTQHQTMKALGRVGSVIRVNELSQDDVTGAVLDVPVEGDVTLREALRLLLAHAQGNATGLESGTVAFKSLDGSKTRIAGTVAAGNRTITSRDTTP